MLHANMCQCTLFDVGGVEIHSIECIEYFKKIKAMSKMSKIDQIHLRAMLCMSETSKMGKEHTHTFWLITSLILNGFSIRKKF